VISRGPVGIGLIVPTLDTNEHIWGHPAGGVCACHAAVHVTCASISCYKGGRSEIKHLGTGSVQGTGIKGDALQKDSFDLLAVASGQSCPLCCIPSPCAPQGFREGALR
jgi:hypothetical protein